MIDFEDIAYSILALWVAIIAFVTAPLWGAPYFICKSISNGKEWLCEMKYNPADQIKGTMWHMLKTHGQKENIPALKEYCYDLIQMMTQKTAGQPRENNKKDLTWDELDMTINAIVIEAVALVLSGRLDELC